VSVHTDPIPLVPSDVASSRVARARELNDRDLELVARVASGDADAVEQLAERLAIRAQRVARALMDGSDDASDAALHALIEALRAHANYRGQLRLERWGDRVTALSVVRFARAVRRRNGERSGHTRLDSRAGMRVDERGARTFEQYLAMLSESNRQTLLLRHALGFGLGELADALQCSLPEAREQLLAARRELRALVRRKSDGAAQVLGEGAQRWCALRDREALGGMLGPAEVAEVTALEARDAEVWAFVAQVRALELFFDASRDDPHAAPEHELAARAVAALEVTSPTQRNRAIAPEREEDLGPNLDGSHAVRRFAIGASVALAVASAVALWRYQPPSVPLPLVAPVAGAHAALGAPVPHVAREVEQAAPRPTVEAMPTARTASRGAKLLSNRRLLSPNTLLSQGDTVEAGERAGCLQIEPDGELCLAPHARLTLQSLLAGERKLALLSGRVVLRVGGRAEARTPERAARAAGEAGAATPARWTLLVGDVELQAVRGVLAVERAPDGKLIRLRTLRAPVELRAGDVRYTVAEAHAATLRADGVAREMSALPPIVAERDWELLATDLYPGATAGAVGPPSTVQKAPASADRAKLASPAAPSDVARPASAPAAVGPEAAPASAPVAEREPADPPAPESEAARDLARLGLSTDVSATDDAVDAPPVDAAEAPVEPPVRGAAAEPAAAASPTESLVAAPPVEREDTPAGGTP
jgi:DNA-directed RNA polymerase specialized sigma24 family protein